MGKVGLLQLGSENLDMHQSCASTPAGACGRSGVVLPP